MTLQRLTVAALFSAAITFSQAPPAAAPARGGRGIQADPDHPIMKIGTAAPDFALPGIDGKTHKLADYAKAKVLAIVFESNHCPVSQLYESRINALYEDYRNKGVALVVVNPNNPKSVRLNELGYTDLEDSLAEMKIRSAYRKHTWPYLYDGETQAFSTKFGVVATPHIYIFDQERKLRYQGHIDDNQREELVKAKTARIALDALLAGNPVPTPETRAFGCSTKWLSKSTGPGSREEEMQKIQAEPVKLEVASADDIKKLRANKTEKIMVVSFWSTKCKSCMEGFNDLETAYRMYRGRAYNFTTVSTDTAADKAAALAFLQKEYATSPNLQYSGDIASLQAAMDLKWKAGTPFTVVLDVDGKVIYQKEGKLDKLEFRRKVLAAMPDTRNYVGSKAYWNQPRP